MDEISAGAVLSTRAMIASSRAWALASAEGFSRIVRFVVRCHLTVVGRQFSADNCAELEDGGAEFLDLGGADAIDFE